MNKQLIYGDIGGTKTLLQIAELKNGTVHEQGAHRYRSSEYSDFADILTDFLDRISATGIHCKPITACFAVAGPVVAQQAQLTNLPWQMSAAQIAQTFLIPHVKLLNDFEAAALAVEILTPSDLASLQQGREQAHAMRVILGAGTGMGVAWLAWQKDSYQPISTEAGHVDFAPTSALQIRLLETLQKKFPHVSVERLLSGAGLTHIFNFLQTTSTEFSSPAPSHLDEEDSGATVTALAIEQNHPVAVRSLELFAEIYGAYAGNLALTGLCRNGVYIAGGIAPRIIHILRAGGFMRAFCNKGRFSKLMHDIPVQVITNPSVSLLGAKRKAQDLLHVQT
ncbi:glucokinase [Nitrosomonas aestuarii]|uniref:glucokinase n=1 Tax=Nitrosomonas aestuarii TaxID=52441 RepID=UPI000D3177C7|nr:glucokinase [Nitrosomonas aestuarii]PTN12196.1 glucokinase [Nitrosomonas aestuarii]